MKKKASKWVNKFFLIYFCNQLSVTLLFPKQNKSYELTAMILDYQ